MPIENCARQIRSNVSPLEHERALDGLRQLPPEDLQMAVLRTSEEDIAQVLHRASEIVNPDGRHLSSDLFQAFGTVNVVRQLERISDATAMVLEAAAASSPDVIDAVMRASIDRRVLSTSFLDHAYATGNPRVQRATTRLIQMHGHTAARARIGPLDSIAIGTRRIRECHARLGQGPDADAQPVRLLMGQLRALPIAATRQALFDSSPTMVADILTSAAEVRHVPANTRPLVTEVFDMLPAASVNKLVAVHPKHIAHAAAMSMDARTLGRVFSAACEAGPEICGEVSSMARFHPKAPFEHVLRLGVAHEIAALLTMASLAGPQIGESVLIRAADHGGDPLGRLLSSQDGSSHAALHQAAQASHLGPNVIDEHRTRAARHRTQEATREDASPNPSGHFSTVRSDRETQSSPRPLPRPGMSA